VWNSQVKALEPDGNRWKIKFENGSTALGDLLIGADGADSKTRPHITERKPFFTGLMLVEGTVSDSATETPHVHELLQDGRLIIVSDELTLSVYSKGDGGLVFYLGLKTEENWVKESGIDFSDGKQVYTWFKTKYAGWAKPWDELLLNAQLPFIPRPQYCMPLDQTWVSKPNITMIGDAAHVMPPYAGEGVNMAVEDAFELFANLQREASIPLAISTYEGEMRERSANAARQNLLSTKALHSVDAASFVVDAVLDEPEEEEDIVEQALEAQGVEIPEEEAPPLGPQIRMS
jgi:2-polyprenyl-6-methoxyphenol hydroxylase-like FAD-dependent oxidoreductase